MYFSLSSAAGIAWRALDLEHAGEHGPRSAVAVRSRKILLRHAAGQQRGEASLFDERHVLRAHPLVVDHVAARERLAVEMRQRRRVARAERVGHHAETGAIEERRGRRLRHARVLRVGRPPGLHHLHERLGDELRAADAFDQHRARRIPRRSARRARRRHRRRSASPARRVRPRMEDRPACGPRR